MREQRAPQTNHGKSILDRLRMKVHPNWLNDYVLAIESEAAAMERERLRAAIPNIGYYWHQPPGVPDRDGFRTYSARQVDKLLMEPEEPA